MYPHPIIEDLDIVEDIKPRIISGPERLTVHALYFDRGHETFSDRVVTRSRYRSHRWRDPVSPHRPSQQQGFILTSVICMMYEANHKVVAIGCLRNQGDCLRRYAPVCCVIYKITS